MAPSWALVGPDGSCEGIVTHEGDEHGQALAGGRAAVPVSLEQAAALGHLGHHVRRRGEGWQVLDEDSAEQIDLSRGLSPDHAKAQRARRRSALATIDNPARIGLTAIEANP